MRILYFGTPAEAVPPLEALHAAGHEVLLVVTQPDRRRGRGGKAVIPSPVRQSAEGLGLAVAAPHRASEIVAQVRECDAELGVVVAFGQLLPPELLQATRHGFVNLHFSLLPRWRGAAPVERAILAGDAETGVSLMGMEAGLDTGPVYVCERVLIDDAETAGELTARLVAIGAAMLVEHLDRVPGMEPVPQRGEATYATKLEVAEFEIDWARPAAEIVRLVRTGNPRPGAWTMAGERRLKVLRSSVISPPASPPTIASPGVLLVDIDPGVVATADGMIVLEEVQPEGRAPMPGPAWAAGFRGTGLGPGSR